MTTASPRLEWIAAQLDVRPGDRVLEIGPGHGVLAAVVLGGLRSGALVGVDRSAAMVAASERRNAAAVRDGRARFVHAAFLDAELDDRFDRIVAARVAEMARPDELRRAVSLLAPTGRLVLAFDSPDDGRTAELLGAVERTAAAVGVAAPRVVTSRSDGVRVTCCVFEG